MVLALFGDLGENIILKNEMSQDRNLLNNHIKELTNCNCIDGTIFKQTFSRISAILNHFDDFALKDFYEQTVLNLPHQISSFQTEVSLKSKFAKSGKNDQNRENFIRTLVNLKIIDSFLCRYLKICDFLGKVGCNSHFNSLLTTMQTLLKTENNDIFKIAISIVERFFKMPKSKKYFLLIQKALNNIKTKTLSAMISNYPENRKCVETVWTLFGNENYLLSHKIKNLYKIVINALTNQNYGHKEDLLNFVLKFDVQVDIEKMSDAFTNFSPFLIFTFLKICSNHFDKIYKSENSSFGKMILRVHNFVMTQITQNDSENYKEKCICLLIISECLSKKYFDIVSVKTRFGDIIRLLKGLCKIDKLKPEDLVSILKTTKILLKNKNCEKIIKIVQKFVFFVVQNLGTANKFDLFFENEKIVLNLFDCLIKIDVENKNFQNLILFFEKLLKSFVFNKRRKMLQI
ncbi:hypothetical protein MHBO_000836 [Bonamia ostreae]|uniref:Uncharacterized protein n=1 Tax=Bonamia ostreae TaxID=126728 RepID=A0ABV2AI79_9EUKA